MPKWFIFSERPRALGNMHVLVACQTNVENKQLFLHLVEIARYQKHH